MISVAILTFVTETFFTALIENFGADVYESLKGDAAKTGFKHALTAAIQRYATSYGYRRALAKPLLEVKGFLTAPDIARELTNILRSDRLPDTELIGRHWKASFEYPPDWRDFNEEAKHLLNYLENEMENIDAFRAIFANKYGKQVVAQGDVAIQHLDNIEAKINELVKLVENDLTSLNIQGYIRDYTGYIEEKTRGFVGRKFIFEAIENFFSVNKHGYILVRGDPGIGKSALLAQLIKSHPEYLYHFNIRAEGINKAGDFLKNICAQLIATYQLNYPVLPPEATQDSGFLKKLLEEVSKKLAGSKCVIVVDALDEVDNTGMPPGANTLYLPLMLPEGVYMVCTMRRETDANMPLRIDMPQQLSMYIEQDNKGNIADIEEYITLQISHPGIQSYIHNQEIDDELFVRHMVEKSQGNFIYLRMVLPEIERGVYSNLNLEAIPTGLQSYYQDHWRRIRQQSELDWFEYKLPIVLALTVIKEPVSIDLLSDFSSIGERRKLRAVLQDFEQFIYKLDVDSEEGKQRRYRWYHASFFDFISHKEEIAEEKVDLRAAHKKIADNISRDLDLFDL